MSYLNIGPNLLDWGEVPSSIQLGESGDSYDNVDVKPKLVNHEISIIRSPVKVGNKAIVHKPKSTATTGAVASYGMINFKVDGLKPNTRYQVIVFVRVNSNNPFATNNINNKFYINTSAVDGSYNISDGNNKDVSVCLDNWQALKMWYETGSGETTFEAHVSAQNLNVDEDVYIDLDDLIFFDDFAVFQQYNLNDTSGDLYFGNVPAGRIVFKGNPVVVQAVTSTPNAANFRFDLLTKINQTNETRDLVTLSGYPGDNGKFDFDLRKLVEPEIKYLEPNSNNQYIEPLTFFTQISSYWGADKVYLQEVADPTAYIALPGALPYLDWPGNTYFDSTLVKFLTWQPKEKTISRDQPEWLYFLMTKDVQTVYINFLITYLDGTTGYFDRSFSGVSSLQNYYCAAPVGIEENGLQDLNSGKTIDNVKIYLDTVAIAADTDINNAISEVQTYIVDQDYYENKRYFLFANSLGGFDTFRITGDIEGETEIIKENARRITYPVYQVDDAQDYVFGISRRNKFTANTGYLTKESRLHAQELFGSDKIYLLNNNKRIPVIINDDSVSIMQDRANIHTLEFEFIMAHYNPGYNAVI